MDFNGRTADWMQKPANDLSIVNSSNKAQKLLVELVRSPASAVTTF